jgi:transglutaminase-like putative cysteine protease
VMREHLWRMQRVGYAPGTRAMLMRAGIVTGLVVIALAWSAPAASASSRLADAWDRSENPWHSVQDTFQRLFGGVRGGTAVTADYYGGPTLNMGGPISLSNTTVMYVYAPAGYRYYWRSRIFDTYDSGEWSTTSEARKSSEFGIVGAEQGTDYALRRSVTQKFELLMRASRLVYAAPQPVSFASLPISYDVRYTTPGSEDFVSVKVIRSQTTLAGGTTYTATSSMSLADEFSLRTSSVEYPDWVTEEYLQVPDNVTQRTKDLAAQITAPYDNPYDKARAIEAYLRENITYEQQIQPVPSGREAVDYFLFDSKTGYCTYYAGAMVMMLRSQGVPARLAAGFAQGEYDTELQAYRVSESDAHAWVEVFFPGYGWIEFEPTSAQPPVTRAAQPSPSLDGPLTQDPFPNQTDPDLGEIPNIERPDLGSASNLTLWQRIQRIKIPVGLWWGLGLLVVAAGAVVGGWFWIEERGLRNLTGVSKSYARLNVYAPLLGLRLPDSATPYERASTLGNAIPEGDKHVKRITALYIDEQYAPRRNRVNRQMIEADDMATDNWNALRPKMVREIANRWTRRVNPFSKNGKH